MVLDLKQCYLRLKASRGWLFRFVTEHWSLDLHRNLGGGSEKAAEAA
jgi:hypothetical protein